MSNTKTVAEVIATKLEAMRNCVRSGNKEWYARHSATLDAVIYEHLPSGSGIDTGTKFVLERSGSTRLTFTCSFHHMNEHGYYDGWTEHTITARPEFVGGFSVKVSGLNRNDICEYLGGVFTQALSNSISDV